MTRFGRVRITLKAPAPPPPSPKYPSLMAHLLPTIADCEVHVLGDDGQAISLSADVIDFHAGCDGEPARATIRLFPDQVDIEAIAAITLPEPQKTRGPL